MLDQLHPSHLQLVIPVLQRETIHKLASCKRLSTRLTALLAHKAAVPEAQPTIADRLALLPWGVVERTGMAIAALLYGRQLARYVDAASIAVIEQVIDTQSRLDAIRQAARGTIALPAVSAEFTPTELATAINETCWRALARWRDLVSPSYHALAALRLPATGLPTPLETDADPAILHVIEGLAFHG